MKEKDDPIKGCASLSKNKKKLNIGEYVSRILLINKLRSIIKKLTAINNNTKITIIKNFL